MLPGMELMGCTDLAVPPEVMHHVVRVESSYNPFAIGVVGGRLVRQPRNLPEAVATAQMLESRGFNFSLGLAQVNRYNLKKYGIGSYEAAFQTCPNLIAGARILAECYSRSKGDWGDSLSCYYSGNFVTGYRHGYVQKVFASMGSPASMPQTAAVPIEVSSRTGRIGSAESGSPRSQSAAGSEGQGLAGLRSASTRASRVASTRLAETPALQATTTRRADAVPRDARTAGPEAVFQARAGDFGPGADATSQESGEQRVPEEPTKGDSAFVF